MAQTTSRALRSQATSLIDRSLKAAREEAYEEGYSAALADAERALYEGRLQDWLIDALAGERLLTIVVRGSTMADLKRRLKVMSK